MSYYTLARNFVKCWSTFKIFLH